MISDGWCRTCQRPAPTAKHTGICRHCQQATEICRPLAHWLRQTTPLLLARPEYGVLKVVVLEDGAAFLVKPPFAMRRQYDGVVWCILVVEGGVARCESAASYAQAERIFDGALPVEAHRGYSICTQGHHNVVAGPAPTTCLKCGVSARVIHNGEPEPPKPAPPKLVRRPHLSVVMPTTTPTDSIRTRRAILSMVPKRDA